MRRREFIALLGGAAASVPFAARAQQTPTPLIGILLLNAKEHPITVLSVAAFAKALSETRLDRRPEPARSNIAGPHADNERMPSFASGACQPSTNM